MNRRKHGYKFTKPLTTQEECDRVLHSIQAKKPSKVTVTVESAFAEFDDKVDYRNGLESASKHLDTVVESLEKGWVDVLSDYNRQPSIRCNMGYTESELTLTIDPKRRALNQAQLQIMKTTSAEKMVETGIIDPFKYALVKKTQQDLSILLGDDGLRTRREEGSILRLCFIESAKNIYVDIKVPKKLPTAAEIMAVDDAVYESYDECGVPVLEIEKVPTFQYRLKYSSKRRHYWILSEKPNVGKTLNMQTACDVCFAFCARYQHPFWDTFDEQAQFVFIDEYGNDKLNKLEISELNLLCDGGYKFNMKNKAPQALLDANAIVIIMSNKHPEKVYVKWMDGTVSPDRQQLALLRARFNIIKIH